MYFALLGVTWDKLEPDVILFGFYVHYTLHKTISESDTCHEVQTR